MGSISIGLKSKPHGDICVFEWDIESNNQKYVAVTMSNCIVSTVEEFCSTYTDKEEARRELQIYKENGDKFVLYTRSFSYDSTKSGARMKQSLK